MSGASKYDPTKGIVKSFSDPKKALLSAATGGLSAQADSLSGGTSASDALETGIGAATGALKGLGGGAAHGSNIEPGIQRSVAIDPNKYINAAPTVAPTAQAFTSAPTAINTAASDKSRNYQNFLAQQLQAQTLGQGPSLAQGQFQNNLDQSIAAQHALAASATGGNIGLAQRQAAMNTGNLNVQAANQAAQLRMQEQLQAQGLLGQTATNQRGQDIGLATSQAGLTQNNQQFNAGAQQQNSQFNANQEAQLNSLRQQYMAMGLSAEQANLQADNAWRQAQLQNASINAGIQQGNRAADTAYTGQIYNTLGTIGAAGVGAYTGGAFGAAGGAAASPQPMSVQESSNLLPATPDAGYASPTPGQSATTGFSNAMNPTGQPSYSYAPINVSKPSDERVKEKVRSGDRDIKGFLDALAPHTYEYKRKSDGEGPHTSVMAQELEKTPMGARMVKAAPDGTKQVDYGEGLATMTAAMAYLNDRLNTIESGKKSAAISKLKGKK